jgi:hypothetical protein
MTLHTNIPPRSEIERLLTVRAPGCISIYLPTNVITQDAQADRIELRTSQRRPGNSMLPASHRS